MRYLLTLLLLIFTGCSTKICGINEKVFSTFTKQKQEEICKAYAQAVGKAELLKQKRLLLAEENRKKELELELKKVQCLYQPRPNDPYASTQILDIRIVSGEIVDGNRRYPIVPMEFELARKEVRKVCFDRYCFWITYQGGMLIVNVDPAWEKERFERYVGNDGDFFKTKRTVYVVPRDWFRGEYRTIVFKKDGAIYKLRLYIRYQ